MPQRSGWGLRHGTDLKVIASELRRMDDREVLKRFRRELRAAAAPMVPAVRASISAIPSTQQGPRGGGLRTALKRATKLRIRTAGRLAGVAVFVDGSKMPSGARALPAYMEGTKRPWRHPVYGHDQVWAAQPSHPYFFPVVRPLGIRGRIAVNRAIDSITKDITGRRAGPG